MTNSLATRNFSEIMSMGDVFFKSGLFKDLQSAAQAAIKIQAGAELGLPAFASMSGIAIIQGKAVLGANLIATLVENDPRYEYKIIRSDDTVCEIEFYKNGKPSGKVSFTIKEADNAGLTGKDNWKKYPSDMLFARCISRGTRRFAPGVFGGAPVYTPDELGVDTDEDGSVIPGQFKNVPDPIPPEQEAPPPVEQAQYQFDPDIQPVTEMPLDTAKNIKTKEGVFYGDLTNDRLEWTYRGCVKSLKDPKYTNGERERLELKRDASATVYVSRQASAA